MSYSILSLSPTLQRCFWGYSSLWQSGAQIHLPWCHSCRRSHIRFLHWTIWLFPDPSVQNRLVLPAFIHRAFSSPESKPGHRISFFHLTTPPTSWAILSAAESHPPPLNKRCWWKECGFYWEWNNSCSGLEIVIWSVTLQWNSSEWKTELETQHVSW